MRITSWNFTSNLIQNFSFVLLVAPRNHTVSELGVTFIVRHKHWGPSCKAKWPAPPGSCTTHILNLPWCFAAGRWLFIDLLFLKFKANAKKKKKQCCFKECSIQEFEVISLKSRGLSEKKSRKWERLEKHKALCPVKSCINKRWSGGNVAEGKKGSGASPRSAPWAPWRKGPSGFRGPTFRNKHLSPPCTQDEDLLDNGEPSDVKQRLVTHSSC